VKHTSAISRVSRVGLGASVLFAALAVAVTRHNETIQSIDDYIQSWAVANRGHLSSSIAGWITWGGASALTLLALIIVGALALRGNRRPRTRLGAGILLAGVAGIGGYLEPSINSWIGRARPPKVDWTAAAIATRMTLEGVLGSLVQPLLVIFGRKDRLVPYEQAERFVREAPNTQLVMFEEGNHVCNNLPYLYQPLAGDWMAEKLAGAVT
jgi:pimeloyl-ACP methyl ester carboxylesterase